MPIAENDNPLQPSPAQLQRIRVRAYHLWESEGQPNGQSAAFWERASALDAMQTYRPAPMPATEKRRLPPEPDGALVEEASLEENLGEFPARLTDQGDTMPAPESREIAREFRDGER